jgi:hypothetical protein
VAAVAAVAVAAVAAAAAVVAAAVTDNAAQAVVPVRCGRHHSRQGLRQEVAPAPSYHCQPECVCAASTGSSSSSNTIRGKAQARTWISACQSDLASSVTWAAWPCYNSAYIRGLPGQSGRQFHVVLSSKMHPWFPIAAHICGVEESYGGKITQQERGRITILLV